MGRQSRENAVQPKGSNQFLISGRAPDSPIPRQATPFARYCFTCSCDGGCIAIVRRRQSCSRSSDGHMRVVEFRPMSRRPSSMSTCVWANVCEASVVLRVFLCLRTFGCLVQLHEIFAGARGPDSSLASPWPLPRLSPDAAPRPVLPRPLPTSDPPRPRPAAGAVSFLRAQSESAADTPRSTSSSAASSSPSAPP